MLVLAGLSACGQMGPLQLPDSTEPVTAENGDDEDREADER
jgi:predicted small lipoprotein YifL